MVDCFVKEREYRHNSLNRSTDEVDEKVVTGVVLSTAIVIIVTRTPLLFIMPSNDCEGGVLTCGCKTDDVSMVRAGPDPHCDCGHTMGGEGICTPVLLGNVTTDNKHVVRLA